MLASGSVALDTGSAANCPATDQRGFPRPLGPHRDVGAVEGDGISSAISNSATQAGSAGRQARFQH